MAFFCHETSRLGRVTVDYYRSIYDVRGSERLFLYRVRRPLRRVHRLLFEHLAVAYGYRFCF